MDEADDQQLMTAVAEGDERAFRILAVRHLAWALRLAGRLTGNPADAEDIVQEAMLRVWTNAPRWRPVVAGGLTARRRKRRMRHRPGRNCQ